MKMRLALFAAVFICGTASAQDPAAGDWPELPRDWKSARNLARAHGQLTLDRLSGGRLLTPVQRDLYQTVVDNNGVMILVPFSPPQQLAINQRLGIARSLSITNAINLNALGNYLTGVGAAGIGEGARLTGAGNFVGAYFTGGASVIDAQGRFLVNREAAQLTREAVNAEKLVNRRRAFDLAMYIRERTPTLAEEKERSRQENVRQMVLASEAEMWSGKALNDLFDELQRRRAFGVIDNFQGNPMPLNEEMLKRINLSYSNSPAVNITLFRQAWKDGGRITWPIALTGDEFRIPRTRIDLTLPNVVKALEAERTISAADYRDIEADLAELQRLQRQNRNLSPDEDNEARRFLSDFKHSLVFARRRDAGKYMKGLTVVKGKGVPDLVAFVQQEGIQFTKALEGDETAYRSLYYAMRSYVLGGATPQLRREDKPQNP